MSWTLLLISLAASGPRILLSQETEEDSDLASRGPYEFQFRVDDPETYNKYEIQETGDPDIVRGSYRINLPDGRTQVVNYEVHPDRGYEARITYEGEAQYPDSPGYVASPYGPPEPLRPGYEKFKRDSAAAAASLLAETGDGSETAKKRDARKVEINFSNNGPIKKLKPKAEDLIAAQTKIDVEQIEKKDVVNEKTKSIGVKKHSKKEKNIIEENLPANYVVDEENNDDFYDTQHSPQAEPLSLRQNTKPRNKTNKKKETETRRAEFRPEELSRPQPTFRATSAATSKSIIKEDENVFVPFIYEAVPSPRKDDDLHLNLAEENVKTAENILDDIYTESDPDPAVVDLLEFAFDPDLPVVEFREVTPRPGPGIQIAELIPVTGAPAPAPPPSNRVKNHHKRKIDIKDYNKNPVDPNPYLYLLKLDYPTIYRSQTDLAPAVSAAGYRQPAGNIPVRGKHIPNINTEDYEHLYQTIFGEADLVQSPQKVLRKVRVPKQLVSPRFLSPGAGAHHSQRLKLVQAGLPAASS